MPEFQTSRKILFQHCDPAGIVFYPRYFDLINAVVEEWCEVALGVSFAEMHMVRHTGVPLRRIEVSFLAPCRLGEEVDFALGVTRLGRSSAECRITVSGGGRRRLDGSFVLVHCDLSGGGVRATPFPDPMAAAIRRFATPAPAVS